MIPGYDVEDAVAIHDSRPGEPDEGALLVRAPDFGGEDIWIAKSQITEDSEVYEKGHEGTLIITEWLARKKGWL
jgi:hypothetical protein